MAILLAALPGAALPAPATAQAPGRRAIVVSYDALNEGRVAGTLGEAVPTFQRLRREAACTDGARPMFPSLTAASHAAIWTGAYGNVNGIAGNQLHRPDGGVLGLVDGFRAASLDAEPAWLAFGRQDLRVTAIHVTQAPDIPGFPTRPDAEGRRAEAAATLARPTVAVLNGYNTKPSAAVVVSERERAPRPAGAWRGLGRLPAGAPAPLEVAWPLGERDSVFALLTGAEGRYDRMIVAVGSRALDGAAEVVAREASPARPDEPLARWFSPAVAWTSPAGRVRLRWRLFALAPDGRRFTLFQAPTHAISANRDALAAAHDSVTGGFVGNTANDLWGRGAFGPTYRAGGDGTAERRYLETAELAAQSAIAGVEWAWRSTSPDVLLTYLAIGDDVDHEVWGEASAAPPVAADTARVAAARRLRAAVWGIADRHLAALRRLASARGDAVFVTGDHGMRASWRVVRPNAALVAAGLAQATDGRLDARVSQAVAPTGYWVTVNTARRGGPVPDDSATVVADRVEAVLRAIRDSAGAPVVLAVHRPAPADTLGIGGAAGGDLYPVLAPGWRATENPRGGVLTDEREPRGVHGFPSLEPDMQATFCAWGAALPAGRHAAGRLIDVIPTVADWLGARPPRDATGRSWLPVFRPR